MANAGSFNITNKVIEYAAKNIMDMPGNNGQQVLVDKLLKQMENGRVILNAVIDDDGDFTANSDMDLDFSSNHPEAIEEIIKSAIEHSELLAKQAEIPGSGWSFEEAKQTGNWKIVGLDQ
jgi:hypothetical protein